MIGRLLLLMTFASFTFVTASSQGLSVGFRAGLSYSKFVGDLDMSIDGEELEKYSMTSGFHIGVSLDYGVTDLFGFRTELMFSQRGTDYSYEGESYYFLARGTLDEKLILGTRNTDKGISQAALGMPIVAYYKFGSFEISGGVHLDLIMASTGGGGLDFDGQSLSGNDVDPFEITLSHNYQKDRALQAGPPRLQVRVDGNTILTPETTGAYYDYDVKDGNMYSLFDFGITGGLAYYLNEGLYLSGKVIYGLLDVDDNQYDISYYRLDGSNNYVYRADKNVNLTIQASIGFLF